ncbi:regulatory protein RecX [Limosilactobacillus fermentum]|nr:regulatory protein RecX [Limosilactobacillus fermentum]
MEKESQIRQITAIVAQKRPGRFNVFLNGQYAFQCRECFDQIPSL